LSARLTAAMTFMDSLLRTAHEGQVLRHGIRAAIIGRPNVGKSSLLNQLLGHERAIVSPVPGTTRDTIQETANVRGLPVIFVDTAGLRESSDGIEAEGIRRSRQTLDRAELILQVFDASQPAAPEDIASLADYRHKTRVLVRNKIDLGSRLTLSADPHAPVADVSCVTGQGIEELKDHIKTLVWAGAVQAESLEAAISSRHQDALRRGRVGVARAREALGTGATLELVALDLRIGTEAVGEVVGKTATEDLLDAIFSQFCIGK
jgi:tRNA modification GTPase